jgi:hypothetical protein
MGEDQHLVEQGPAYGTEPPPLHSAHHKSLTQAIASGCTGSAVRRPSLVRTVYVKDLMPALLG